VITSLMSAAAIIFGTELGFFQRILDTEELTGNQWLICIGAALAVVVVSEVWKLVLRRREAAAQPAEAPVPDDQTAPVPA
jgi:P-type Ca2+ transporter type 2C